ncbi:subtilase family protein [Formosa agariphila KMM 3901]|uniref:Subtilase family protein n=1 Tax=Formosa agariphila (strain DSM 15362 / KCTC 12365 / LMG 23005 / KMM 3901 / M-2Alg 35-1) TaxID=1347342 RepID=T2KR12_FORAG|nr:S8 family peptidase [Formosa agariphila]CDF81272.1 subtilase family protein [Formosa agariphila KMM 3901]
MNFIKPILFTALTATLLTSCGGGAKIISTPIENIDTAPLKVSDLNETQKQTWGHLDLISDTIPGMSVEKAYTEIIKDNKGTKVIVAVIDSGIDIEHEDLDGVIWTNEKEIPGNGIDDDKNGYVDDIHGWNFLGDAYEEQLEFVRLLASGDTSNPDYARAEKEYEEEFGKYTNYKTQYDQLLQQLKGADDIISAKLNKTDYNLADVEGIVTGDDEALTTATAIAKYILGLGFDDVNAAKEDLQNGVKSISDRLNYNLNKDFKGRTTGDDINDLTDTGYGNANVLPTVDSESHGTHVTGIIAAERNNGLGANGVANNVEIMSLRVVSNGDEYDKDVALGIRYAVDNGAKVINGSFGKYYSPHSDWVRDAIAYAAKNDVVLVMAAGNEGIDLDKNDHHYPTDNINNGPEISDTFISVGALAPKYGPEMVAGFSNYGKINVDVFAPGAQIYSTVPGSDKYKTMGGTSMASPAVAGVAALIRSQFPKLSAAQVKQVILDSGLPIKIKVIVGGDANNEQPFDTLSKSGKMVNAYNALIMASKLK